MCSIRTITGQFDSLVSFLLKTAVNDIVIEDSQQGDTTVETCESGQKRKRQGKRSQEAKARRTAKNNERKRRKRQEEARERSQNLLPARKVRALRSGRVDSLVSNYQAKKLPHPRNGLPLGQPLLDHQLPLPPPPL